MGKMKREFQDKYDYRSRVLGLTKDIKTKQKSYLKWYIAISKRSKHGSLPVHVISNVCICMLARHTTQ